jgi:hypothetical protein
MHIKQLLQLAGGTPQRLPPLGSFVEEGLDLWNCVHQAVGITVGTRGPLVLHQCLYVGLDFDLLTLIPATPVSGQ